MNGYYATKRNSKLINAIYEDFQISVNQQHALLSDLSKEMLHDIGQFYTSNLLEKAELVAINLADWLKKDLFYFISFEGVHKKMYEWDVVSSMQMFGEIIKICEQFKQWNIAHFLRKEYSKMSIYYSEKEHQLQLSNTLAS